MRTLRAARWLLRDVSLPSLRQHRLRSALTLLGVAIGAQVIVAITLLNRSILASFEHTVETIAGSADLQVANVMAGVPEELAMRIAADPGVASASGLIHGTLGTAHGDLALFGVDLLANQRLRETQFPREHVHIADELRFVNATDSLALSTSFARRAGLALGAALEVRGPNGASTLAVRGTLDPVGPTALFGGDVGLVDLPTAQRLLDREGRFDQIDVELRDDGGAAAVAARLRALVGGAGTVEPPRERGARLGSMLSSVQTVLTLVSLLAIVVGAFIVYNTMDTAVAHRHRELTLARALGYTRRTVLTAVALEAIAYGAIGTAIGAVLGFASARLSLGLVTLGVGAIWGRTDAPGVAIAPGDVLLVGLVGVGGSLVSSVLPALRAARIQIVEQLREERPVLPDAPTEWRSAALGGVLTLAGILVLGGEIRLGGTTATVAVIMLGIVLCAVGLTWIAPLVLRGMARLARLAVRAWRRPSPVLAVDNILRDPSRSRGAIAALMVAFALVLIVGSFVRSLRGSILSWVDQTVAADLFVSPSMALPLPAGPTLGGELEGVLRGVPGVAEVGAARMINARVGNTLAVLRTEGVADFGHKRYAVVEGDLSAATFAAFARGEVVFISDNLAYRQGLHVGETLELETPAGARAFRIGAVVVDYTLDIGTIIVDRATYRSVWRDDLVNTFGVWLAPDADFDRVRAEISTRVASRSPVTILSGREFNAQIAGALDGALLMTYAVQLVAIGIAVIGVVNFFLAEVVDRRREIGLLRGVALTRRQVVQMFSVEAALLGAVGGVFAVAFGWLVARLLVLHSTRLVSGWTLTFEFPWGLAVTTVVLASVTALAASRHPTRRAATEPVAELVVGR